MSGRTSGSSAWPSMISTPADRTTINYHATSTVVSSVSAVMNYVSTKTTEISTRRDMGGSDSTLVGADWDPTLVTVANARISQCTNNASQKLTLDKNGFELWAEDGNDKYQEINFLDQDQVVNQYYPMCEQIVKDALASQTTSNSTPIAGVFAFDHNVRSKEKMSFGAIQSSSRSEAQIQNPAGIVHADYTRTSAPKRLNDLSKPPKLNDVLRPKLIAESRDSLLDPKMVQEALDGKRRFAFINVWRNIDVDNPVRDCPLACIDASSASLKDTRVFKIHYVDRVGENYFVCPERQHDWYYYPEMTMNEAILLKQWDSCGGIANGNERDDASRPTTFAIHSAFIDPSCPPGAPPRISIEVRCIVMWEVGE
eukprot:scaffold27690_cov74-Cyclotella_meneghiniana.AAC.4